MEHNISNRQAPVSKRGRPTAEEIAARPVVAAEAPVTVTGIVCPCCGRAMVPKVLSVKESGQYSRCTLCGGRFRVFKGRDGRRMATPV